MLKNKLINRKSKPQLIEEIEKENFERITCSFYRYTKIENPLLLTILNVPLIYFHHCSQCYCQFSLLEENLPLLCSAHKEERTRKGR